MEVIEKHVRGKAMVVRTDSFSFHFGMEPIKKAVYSGIASGWMFLERDFFFVALAWLKCVDISISSRSPCHNLVSRPFLPSILQILGSYWYLGYFFSFGLVLNFHDGFRD